MKRLCCKAPGAIILLAMVMFSGCVTTASSKAVPDKVLSTTDNAIQLTRITQDVFPEYWARPAPDGKSILFYQMDSSKKINECFSIVQADLSSPGRRVVCAGFASQPSWFPDGKNFVYQTTITRQARMVRSSVTAENASMVFITNSACGDDDSQPEVSPDGKTIAFYTRLKGEYFIATVNSDGTNFTVYCPGTSPRWSPDSGKLIFDREVNGHYQIFIMDLNAGNKVAQITGISANNSFPSWSPDGKWIIFQSDRDATSHIYVKNAVSGEEIKLTRGAVSNLYPSWSNDGYIYFSSDSSGNWDIWRVKPVLN